MNVTQVRFRATLGVEVESKIAHVPSAYLFSDASGIDRSTQPRQLLDEGTGAVWEFSNIRFAKPKKNHSVFKSLLLDFDKLIYPIPFNSLSPQRLLITRSLNET